MPFDPSSAVLEFDPSSAKEEAPAFDLESAKIEEPSAGPSARAVALAPGQTMGTVTGTTQAIPQMAPAREQAIEALQKPRTIPATPEPTEEQQRTMLTGVAQPESEIQPVGKPGSILRGASSVAAGILNQPEYLAALLNPATAAAVGARFAPEIAKQFFEDLGKAAQGDNEALGRAAVIGIPALVGGVKAGRTMTERLSAKAALDAVQKASSAAHIDALARLEAAPRPQETPQALLPLSKAALESTTPEPAPPGVVAEPSTLVKPIEERTTDARQNAPDATLHGDVPVQPLESKGQVPVDEGGQGVLTPTEGGIPKETVAPETLPPESSAGKEVSAGAEATTTPAGQVETPGELPIGPGASSVKDVPPPTGGEDVTGVAQRVREKMAAAGQETLPPRGEGISAPDSVERGRELLKGGADPEAAMAQFEQTKRLSADDMAVVRAHAEKLAFDARRAEEQFGTDSPEFRAAQDARNAWADRTKVMQTEWHKTGMAQQGEVDIDTGTFTGLASAYHDATGKDFTEGQAASAKKRAKAGKDADTEAAKAKDELHNYARDRSKQTDAEKAALDAASKVVREAAARAADLERKQAVIDAQRKLEVEKIEQARDAKVKAAADAVTKRNAIKAAQDEIKAAEKRAKDEKAAIEAQRKVEKKAADAASKVVREAAIRKARTAAKELEMDLSEKAWKAAREYIDRGLDNFDEIRNKIATDLGVSVDEVTTALGKDKRGKFLMDEAWKKQQVARMIKAKSKQWLMEQAIPGYQRAIQSIPRLLFGLKVGFHGTVALGTHAPMVAFQPRFWATYVRDFGKMYRMVGTLSPKGQAAARAYYEMQVQDLVRRPNYITARRAGLVNDPGVYEDFNSPETVKYFGKLTTMGNRGYTVLKILRQDMFDQMWDKLPKTAKIPEMAEAIADGLNHATGVVKGRAPRGTNVALFAPRLEASRVMWLAGDPIRAADTFLRWNKADMAEKAFAINQIKEKAWVAGTMLSALALNQGFLSATGSNQKINGLPQAVGGKGIDPFRSDFMKFKVAGMDFSYGNAMISMARLPVRLYRIRSSDGGKLKNLVFPDEDTYSVLGQYARSQASPFASLATTLWLKADFQNRPLPNSNRPVPKRLAAQGVKPYTWPEFWSEQVLPIPAEEAVREVWKTGLGMSEEQIKAGLKAMATISVMAATGARLTDDVPYKPPQNSVAAYP